MPGTGLAVVSGIPPSGPKGRVGKPPSGNTLDGPGVSTRSAGLAGCAAGGGGGGGAGGCAQPGFAPPSPASAAAASWRKGPARRVLVLIGTTPIPMAAVPRPQARGTGESIGARTDT